MDFDLNPNLGCHRCGRVLDPQRVDVEGWLVLDARVDAWILIVCRDCQTRSERDRVLRLLLDS